jgi:FkbM family methyltransferase
MSLRRQFSQLIIDAGANIGLVSIYFANKYPTAIIYAIEPEKSNYDLLVKNAIGYKNIVPIQAALWKNNSPLCIENLDAEKWAFRVTEKIDANNHLINTNTFANLLAMANKNYIDILKIDIEGAEKDLFEEYSEIWIYIVGSFIIDLHEGLRKGTNNSFYSAISKLNYREYIKGENHFINVI